MDENELKWYAVYTKPRWEKKILLALEKKQINAYLPTKTIIKKYSDRFKKVQEIIIPSYVFVQIPKDQQTAIRFIDGIVNFVYWLGKPAVIKDNEIEQLKQFLLLDGTVLLEAYNQRVGDTIEIEKDPFKGQQAVVLSINKNYTELILVGLQMKLTIQNK